MHQNQNQNQNQNQQEIEWLHDKPEHLLMQYQFIIEATVASFIRKGFFQLEEREDLIQQLNLQCLEGKLDKIKTQFNGTVYLRTYFSKVIYNACQEIARKRKRAPQILSTNLLFDQDSKELSAQVLLVIKEELKRLEASLRTLGKKKQKSELCLKLLVRIILKYLDIQFYSSPKTQKQITHFKQYFFQKYDQLSDKEVYTIAIQLFNTLENKTNDWDSLRRWTQQQLDRLIALLNNEWSATNYDRESLKILLQRYFSS